MEAIRNRYRRVYTGIFEALVHDDFESMMFKGNDPIPSYIWTVNYVVIVKRSSKIMTDITFEKIPRNPACA